MPAGPRVRFWLDLAERAAKSAVQGFAGYWLAFQDADADSLFTTANLKAAAAVALLSVATSLVSSRVGTDGDASALPTSVDPAAAGALARASGAFSVGNERSEHEKLAALARDAGTILLDDGIKIPIAEWEASLPRPPGSEKLPRR